MTIIRLASRTRSLRPGLNEQGHAMSDNPVVNDNPVMNDSLFSHPTEAQADAKTEENTSAEPVTMPVFSHQDR